MTTMQQLKLKLLEQNKVLRVVNNDKKMIFNTL